MQMFPGQADQKDMYVNKHPFKMKLKPFSHYVIYEQGKNERHKAISDCISRHLHMYAYIHITRRKGMLKNISDNSMHLPFQKQTLHLWTLRSSSLVLFCSLLLSEKMRKLGHSLDELSWQVRSGPRAVLSIPAPGAFQLVLPPGNWCVWKDN